MNKSSQFKKGSTLSLSKGFTLLEILIGTAIFAVVMVMTTGVIAQSTGYQSKSKALREASEEASRISDLIARDLKTAKGSFTVVDSASPQNTVTFKNGVAMADASDILRNYPSPAPFANAANLDTTSYNSSALIINTDTKIKIYTSGKLVNGQNAVFAKEFNKSAGEIVTNGWWDMANDKLTIFSFPSGSLLYHVTASADNIISTYTGDDALDTTVAFSGFTASDKSGSYYLQSYVNFYVHAETKDFATLPPTTRSMADIRSMVTTRNYAN